MAAADRKGAPDAPEPPASAVERTLRMELDAARARIEELSAQVVALTAERDALRVAQDAMPPAPAGELRLVLKTALHWNNKVFPAGALMPFDPANPPPGCNGLVEGVHYHRQRVLVG